MDGEIDLSDIVILEFEWDEGNKEKNWFKHRITSDESEQIFYNRPLLIYQDPLHSQKEKRLTAYGVTDKGKRLTIVFTLRNKRIRIISARSQSRKERRIYEKNKTDSQV